MAYTKITIYGLYQDHNLKHPLSGEPARADEMK